MQKVTEDESEQSQSQPKQLLVRNAEPEEQFRPSAELSKHLDMDSTGSSEHCEEEEDINKYFEDSEAQSPSKTQNLSENQKTWNNKQIKEEKVVKEEIKENGSDDIYFDSQTVGSDGDSNSESTNIVKQEILVNNEHESKYLNVFITLSNLL